MGYLTTIILCLIELTSSFNIVSHSQSSEVLQVGDSLTLLCKTDKRWEYCDWKHKDPVNDQSRHCSLEWKRATGKVEVQDCNMDLQKRIKVTGNYQNHECGLEVSSVSLEDGGIWVCEMEEYLWGDWRSGVRHEKSFNLTVKRKPLITTPTTTSSTKITTTVSDTSSSSTKTELDGLEIVTTIRPDTVKDKNAVIEPKELQKVENDDHVGGGVVAGIVVAVLALVIGVLLATLIFWKKRRSLEVITLRKMKEQGIGGDTYAFLEETEYSMTEGFIDPTQPPK